MERVGSSGTWRVFLAGTAIIGKINLRGAKNYPTDKKSCAAATQA
jgi:hypothetical protein